MSKRTTNTNKDSDDWDTDPDYIRDMDEMSQRWGGTNRTVGSINMNELIDDVRREHKAMRDKFVQSNRLGDNPSSTTTGGKQKVVSNTSNKEIRREIITSESSSYIKESNGSVLSETIRETSTSPSSYTTTTTTTRPIPPLAPKPNNLTSKLLTTTTNNKPFKADTIVITDPPRQFKENFASTKKIFQPDNSKSSSSQESPTRSSFLGGTTTTTPSPAFKSIQDKIDAFKKEFDNIEHNVAKKSDISKVIKKTTTTSEQKGGSGGEKQHVQYVTRSNEKINTSTPSGLDGKRGATGSPIYTTSSTTNLRPTSASPSHVAGGLPSGINNKPSTSIKSLSERFETLGRESSDDFKRRMEERRREFFDRIKTQVRETRKGLDGFDVDDSDDNEQQQDKRYIITKKSSSPIYNSGSNNDSIISSQKPKIYTRRETTQEQVVSRFVKENDKVVHDETKRNVERTSSCHGSSDDDDDDDGGPQASSIKFIDRQLRTSSPLEQPRRQNISPVDEIKRKVPIVEPEIKGAGLMARTLYDYQAAERDELTFDVDDLITNIEKIDSGWYRGTMTKDGHKRIGLFPANYVKLLNDSGDY